jgi:hypothetical protein
MAAIEEWGYYHHGDIHRITYVGWFTLLWESDTLKEDIG